MPTKTTSAGPIIARARAALGLDAVDELAERISVELLERAAAAVDERVLLDAAADRILTTGEIGRDLGGDVAAARQAAAQNTAALEALRTAQQRIGEVFKHTAARNADDALAVVREEVEDVARLARPVFAKLAGVASAEAAIDANLAESWGVARRLSTRYSECRLAQAIILSAAVDTTPHGSTVGDVVTARGSLLGHYFGTLREPWIHDASLVQHFDRHLARIRSGELPERVDEFGQPQVRSQHRPPWQVDSADPMPALRWVTTTDGAEAWVPSVDDLLASERTAREVAASGGYQRSAHAAREPWEPRPNTVAGPSMLIKRIGG